MNERSHTVIFRSHFKGHNEVRNKESMIEKYFSNAVILLIQANVPERNPVVLEQRRSLVSQPIHHLMGTAAPKIFKLCSGSREESVMKKQLEASRDLLFAPIEKGSEMA